MKSSIVFSTDNGKEIEVTYDRYLDKDYVDGVCVRCDDCIDVIEFHINGKEMNFDSLGDSFKDKIYAEITER